MMLLNLYLAKANTWLKDKKIISNNSSFVELLKYSSVDIDTIRRLAHGRRNL